MLLLVLYLRACVYHKTRSLASRRKSRHTYMHSSLLCGGCFCHCCVAVVGVGSITLSVYLRIYRGIWSYLVCTHPSTQAQKHANRERIARKDTAQTKHCQNLAKTTKKSIITSSIVYVCMWQYVLLYMYV